MIFFLFNIIIADHALSSDFNQPKQPATWKLQPSLADDAHFCKYLSDKLEEFIETNDTSDTLDSSVWKMFRVVMNISYEASLKRLRNTRLIEIDAKITELETKYKQDNSSQTLQDNMNQYDFN